MKALNYSLPSRREDSLWAWLTILNQCINNISVFLICGDNDPYTVLMQDSLVFVLLPFKRSRNDSQASLEQFVCAEFLHNTHFDENLHVTCVLRKLCFER